MGTAVPFLIDYGTILTLLFGGCCANVWTFERLLKLSPEFGTALTFSQMLFISIQGFGRFFSLDGWIPRLKPNKVPLRNWAAQVFVQTAGSLLNNWVYAFDVPLPIQIVFRSAGLAVSMIFGYMFLKRRYSFGQITAVGLVSIGVILATLSRSSPAHRGPSEVDPHRYTLGVTMLTISLVMTAVLGLLQERVYVRYGPCWREGVFFTHFLSLPLFLGLLPQVTRGFQQLLISSDTWSIPCMILAANLVTQLVCVSGVNQLASRVSSVSTNIVLTTRKALSLCLSVWWFGNGWNGQLGLGATLVFLGSLLYTQAQVSQPKRKT
ncbi:hypothetical protein JAAARDRAFT_123135 [Jaapia argillacea MUCL 33604]|uniref:Sugar phosphate transporter domain-containing protein n=1 Tax=Jaapia argillacea MUCL 33604 TaxID=933084 RepID=A0A067Q3L4_9AGAM|nr:hypothetical protein JAAARDRAFT_123135 [Jaapia argillacea MUCL 33604]